ncbi:MAG: trypsin-like peptidase domain-containing protein [Oligoflexales bacterium]
MINKLFFITILGNLILSCDSPRGYEKPRSQVDANSAAFTFNQTVATKDDLPGCTPESTNKIMSISSTNQVVICQDSTWLDINLAHSQNPSMNSMQVYATEASLPACDSSLENSLVFISSSSTILVCAANSWAEVGQTKGAENSSDTNTYQILESSDLAGECSAANQGDFNYIISEKKFIYCSNNIWTDAELGGNKSAQVSDNWREVWNDNVQSTAIIISGVSLYNNATIDAGNLEKIHRFYDGNPAAATDRCTFNSSGSGFVVGQNLVATNAHVAHTWMASSLSSLIEVCSMLVETQTEFLDEIFDFCTVATVPAFAQGMILANTPFRLSELVEPTAILTDDKTLQAVELVCYDGVDRTPDVSTPFADITLYVGNFVSAGDGATPSLSRTLQIDTLRSLVTLRPSHGLAGMHLIFPNSQGIIDDSNFANWVPVTNIDMSLGGSDDLALLQVDTGPRNPVSLSETDFSTDVLSSDGTRLNEDVLLIGYSRGDRFAHFATGNINQVIRFDQMITSPLARNGFFTADNRMVYMYDLVSGGGSSGGPIFNLAGELISYNFAGDVSSADTDFGYGLQVIHIRALLAEPRIWQAPQALPDLNRTP